jgi:hypothetical protein
MTKPNRKIKKLSTAVRRGLKIAKENNIKISRQAFTIENDKGEVCRACTLGMAGIGLFGVREVLYKTEDSVMNHLGLQSKENECLPKKLNLRPKYEDITSVIMYANDSRNKSPEEIADALEACKL